MTQRIGIYCWDRRGSNDNRREITLVSINLNYCFKIFTSAQERYATNERKHPSPSNRGVTHAIKNLFFFC
jgi:hypothetical protein